jgi:hypothetical protein
MKVHEPDQFDRTNPCKLRYFLVQCELNFQDCPCTFNTDRAKVIFAQSYLKGMVLDWFEPNLLMGQNLLFCPLWMNDYLELIHKLQTNFRPHDPVGEAKHQLDHLSMKDGQHINKYIVEFNPHALVMVRECSDTISIMGCQTTSRMRYHKLVNLLLSPTSTSSLRLLMRAIGSV